MKTQRSEYWRAVISGYDPKQTTVRAYCREQGVSEQSFHAWRRRLSEQGRPVSFKLIDSTAATATTATTAMIEVVVHNGAAIMRVPCEESALRIVLAAVRP